jgi:hypothetical protein
MDQWLSNLSPFETYLIAMPAIMLGSILFLGGIILLLEPGKKNDAETLVEIRKVLEQAGADARNKLNAKNERKRTGRVRDAKQTTRY